MSDEQTTFLLLAVLYLVECCLIAGRDSFLFLPRPFGRFWQVQAAGKGLAVRHGVLAVLPPLTPWRPAVLSSPAPLLFHPSGIIHRETGREMRWEEINSLSAENARLYINGAPFARFQDEYGAVEAMNRLKALISAPPETRPAAIRALLSLRGQPGSVKRAVQRMKRRTLPLRLLGTVQLPVMFAMPPVLFHLLPPGAAFLLSAALIFLTGWCISGLFFRIHRKLYPERRGERWGKLFHFLLYPPGTIGAAHALSLPLGSRYHPAAWACALLPERDRRSFLAHLLREGRYPVSRGACSPDAAERFREASREEYEALHSYLDRCGLLPPEEEPEWEEKDGCTRYCPRCLGIYRTEAETCPACSVIPLQPLPARQERQGTDCGGREENSP